MGRADLKTRTQIPYHADTIPCTTDTIPCRNHRYRTMQIPQITDTLPCRYHRYHTMQIHRYRTKQIPQIPYHADTIPYLSALCLIIGKGHATLKTRFPGRLQHAIGQILVHGMQGFMATTYPGSYAHMIKSMRWPAVQR